MYSPNKQVGAIDPVTGLPAQQITNVPPAPSNTLGQSQPTFNPQAQQNSALLYGSVAQRQNSVNATPMFKKKMQ